MELREAKDALKAVTAHALTEYYKNNWNLLVTSSRIVIATDKRVISSDGKRLDDFEQVELVSCTDTTGFGKSMATFEAEVDGMRYTFMFASSLSLFEIIMAYVMDFTS